ncbi:MAG TPA: S8 family peptidase [Leptolyngbyaceae cyanobacterium M33_DOE_097]|uniref:S8 family peptidase n=1 Tax=Oscillatoriales cyanobacterium SpSt-418 TaxID=2282169 RepID=A0A7C3PJW8_9CYAN|nr:S8 family peptidase [Leptolyngbyaceae cyanobacterium M33_DOE_097]
MPPSAPEPGQYRHITFTRETYQFERRTRAYGPRPPGQEYRPQHAQEILQDITQAVQQISQTRRGYGINPEQLFVLEFKNIVIDLRAIFERFGAWVVNEFRDKVNGQDVYRLLVQFPTETSRQLLLDENRLYEAEETDSVVLPPGMRQNFFDALQTARFVSREERIGVRLHEEGFPDAESFYLDVDLWHPGDRDSVRTVLGNIRSMCASYNGQLTEEVRTSSLLLIKVYGSQQLAEALLELDWVARVDLPPKLSRAYSEIFEDVKPPDPIPVPLDDDPLVCVVDSGVVSGHPFLTNWIVEERDFDTGENTPTDLNGHGTSVAGLVVYGDIANCLESNQWQPKVRICSAKVLCHDPAWGPVIPEQHRAEWLIEQAIRYFVKERQCQVFNLSIESKGETYRGGRQFPWAEKLDELARELDVVIVQIAGNCEPPIPESVAIREAFQKAVRDSLLKDENLRICNPGTAALALTVGALSRSDALGDHVKPVGVRLKDAFAGAPAHAPAPFTRVGWGLSYGGNNTAIKPDVVAYGGNWAIQTIAGGSPNWKHFILLGEPTIQREDASGRFITARDGTSFACPHVAHAAAIAASSLEKTLGQRPSANLIRALVGSATYLPPCPPDWLGSEEETLRLIGYGMCSVDDLTASKKNRVRLVAMDEVELDKLHIYRVVIPETFIATKGRRGITVALAYDPPIRASRKEYLANTMWVEALHGLTTEEVEIYRAKNASPDVDTLPSKYQLQLRPAKTDVQWSTLQVRRLKKQTKLKIPSGETEPVVHFVVGCQQRFPIGFDYKQRYGLVVLFWHESEQIELYQELRVKDRVRMQTTRVRTQV